MRPLLLIAGWLAAAACATVIVRHHIAYFRGARPSSFGAFMETGGWIILFLAVLGALAGGLAAPGTRAVETGVTAVGALFIGIGSSLK